MSCHNKPCGNPYCRECYPNDCSSTGCPIQLDTECVIYHKQNNEISALTNLGIGNGATLQLILEQIDSALLGFNPTSFALPVLRVNYIINNLKQFMQAVDETLGALQESSGGSVTETSLVATDSTSIDFTTTGTAGHALTGVVKISPTTNNLLSALSNGLYATPQTLSVNYATKELTITNGNTVSLAALSSGVGGYLGEFSSDPVAINGQTWYNTTTSQLRIHIHGSNRTIQLI